MKYTDEEILENLKIDNNVRNCSKRLNYDWSEIYKILRRNRIPAPTIGKDKRKYKINDNYFDSIDCPEKAYILGFLYADGCNFMRKNQIFLKLSEIDKDILEKINKLIGNERPLYHIKNITCKNKKGKIFKCKDAYQVTIYSKPICKRLNELGMVPNKTTVLRLPKFLDSILLSHFIRGFFDGDGSIGMFLRNNILTFTVDIAMKNELLADDFKLLLETKLELKSVRKWSDNKYWKIGIVRLAEKVKFLEWIYQNAEDLKLKRKFERFVLLKQKTNEWTQSKTSKYIGVTFNKKRNKWIARKDINGKTVTLGAFDLEDKAFEAYQKACNDIKEKKNLCL